MARFSLLVLALVPLLSLAAGFHMFEESGDAAVEAAQKMLQKYNLPEELLPVSLVTEFSFDKEDGSFHLKLDSSCYVKLSNEFLWYGQEISGKVSYGRMENLSGIQSKMLIVWLPVRQLHVDDVESGYVYMEVGPSYKKLSASAFQSPLPCHSDDTGLFSLFYQ